MIDIQTIEMYESYGVYSINGQSCYTFFKECEYLSTCQFSTDKLTKPLTKKLVDQANEVDTKYDFEVDFYELVESQLEKGEE